uniref:Uncharacterized protein n=1 Tax=Chelonoidis abingdonii TaxID=106734 RepID=A0A8C0QRM0_CHEAB
MHDKELLLQAFLPSSSLVRLLEARGTPSQLKPIGLKIQTNIHRELIAVFTSVNVYSALCNGERIPFGCISSLYTLPFPTAPSPPDKEIGSNKLLLVSFDGFHWNYDQYVDTPNMDLLMKQGVKAKYITPPFVTMTSPSHFTTITGRSCSACAICVLFSAVMPAVKRSDINSLKAL